MTVRNFKERILLGLAETTEVTTDTPVRIQEQLEQGGTYVAEFNVNEISADLDTNVIVSIDHINQGVATDDGYEMKRLYYGVVDKITAVSWPHQVTVTCVGPLAKLRRFPGGDVSLSGKTDTEAARYILEFCGVPFEDSDITGWDVTLGTRVNVVWQAGQSGLDMLNELDRVFGCATIEVGAGRVVRFNYSRNPEDYLGPGVVSKTFYRGQQGGTFYQNERDRGPMDEVINNVVVTGVSWDGAKDAPDEGCHYTVFAHSHMVHPIFGSGVEVTMEFSSDLIQEEVFATNVAERLMRWHGMLPDTVRIETSNDGTLNVGDVISVRDSAFGVDLDTDTRYVILNITRDGDLMTIDATGGVGPTAYTTNSGIQICCGTQHDDGTCSDDGTNPGPGDGPNPDKPPDSPTGHCDPLTDPTCIPGVDYPLPPASNTTDPFICSGESDVMNDGTTAQHNGAGSVNCLTVHETFDTAGVYHHRCYAARG